MDYWSLVNTLLAQISPETRAQILDKLTEMNDKLLAGNQSLIQSDLSRAAVLNSRKKDVTELQHPSFDRLNFKGPNPVPINFPINANNPFNPYRHPTQEYNPEGQVGRSPYLVPEGQVGRSSHQIAVKPSLPLENNIPTGSPHEIDLDDVLNDFNEEPDRLEEKLIKIRNLQQKILAEKKLRKKEQRKN